MAKKAKIRVLDSKLMKTNANKENIYYKAFTYTSVELLHYVIMKKENNIISNYDVKAAKASLELRLNRLSPLQDVSGLVSQLHTLYCRLLEGNRDEELLRKIVSLENKVREKEFYYLADIQLDWRENLTTEENSKADKYSLVVNALNDFNPMLLHKHASASLITNEHNNTYQERTAGLVVNWKKVKLLRTNVTDSFTSYRPMTTFSQAINAALGWRDVDGYDFYTHSGDFFYYEDFLERWENAGFPHNKIDVYCDSLVDMYCAVFYFSDSDRKEEAINLAKVCKLPILELNR